MSDRQTDPPETNQVARTRFDEHAARMASEPLMQAGFYVADEGPVQAWLKGEFEQETELARVYLGASGMMMVALDIEGRVTLINRAACAILGYAQDEILGRDWFTHFLPERVRESSRAIFEALLAGEVVPLKQYENVVRTRTGGERTILWHLTVVRDELGVMIGGLGAGSDITERKQAAEALRESEQRFRGLFEASPDAIFVEDLDGRVLDVNTAACRLHNTDRKTLIGLNVRELVPPEERAAALEDFQRLIRGEADFLQTYSWTVNQHAVPVEIRARRFNYDGRPAVLLHVRDISERLETTRALEESRIRAHAVLETTIDAVITIDAAGCIESVNPVTERLFGYTADEIVGRNVRMLMPEPYREEHDGYLGRYLATGRKRVIGIGREATAQRKDGTTFPVELTLTEVHIGDRMMFTAFVRDISERRMLEREVLRISEEERRRIGQDIHDELASRFSGLALLGRGLATQWSREGRVSREMLEEVAVQARAGAELARALARGLSPVKLDSEGVKAALGELMHDVEMVSGIVGTLEVDDELPTLDSGTATQLYRIAQEAITNAVKHAGGGRLELRLQRTGDHLVLSVRDDGRGLPAEVRERGIGSGMGLHIMPYRARVIGATLRIDSTPEAGTTITCTMALTDSRRAEPLQSRDS